MAKKMGRPSKRTDSMVDEIIERLSDGEPLAAICRDNGMPNPSTVYDWMNADPSLSQRFARAREDGFDAIARQALEIADMPPAYTTGEGTARIDAGDVQNRKLQIETRLKLLAKWDPKRYGDKVQVDGPGTGGAHLIQVVTGVPDDDATG